LRQRRRYGNPRQPVRFCFAVGFGVALFERQRVAESVGLRFAVGLTQRFRLTFFIRLGFGESFAVAFGECVAVGERQPERQCFAFCFRLTFGQRVPVFVGVCFG
jgi:hypothetical protein